jgi:hypothetical protein
MYRVTLASCDNTLSLRAGDGVERESISPKVLLGCGNAAVTTPNMIAAPSAEV